MTNNKRNKFQYGEVFNSLLKIDRITTTFAIYSFKDDAYIKN